MAPLTGEVVNYDYILSCSSFFWSSVSSPVSISSICFRFYYYVAGVGYITVSGSWLSVGSYIFNYLSVSFFNIILSLEMT